MRTSKDIGKDHDKFHSEKCNCGEAVFRRLPLVVTEMACQCNRDYKDNVEPITGLGIKTGGWFCTACGRPERFSVAHLFFICESCNKYFTYDFRSYPKSPNPIHWPPANLLCKDCDVPAPTRRRRIVFN